MACTGCRYCRQTNSQAASGSAPTNERRRALPSRTFSLSPLPNNTLHRLFDLTNALSNVATVARPFLTVRSPFCGAAPYHLIHFLCWTVKPARATSPLPVVSSTTTTTLSPPLPNSFLRLLRKVLPHPHKPFPLPYTTFSQLTFRQFGELHLTMNRYQYDFFFLSQVIR